MTGRSTPEWIGKTPDTAIPAREKLSYERDRKCSIEGCNRPHDANNFCRKHDARNRRHGSPFGGTTDRGAAVKFMNEVVLTYQGDNCLAWPFASNGKGYGVFHKNRKVVAAHIYACEQVYGPKPTPSHEVAHSCGNGGRMCCNPRHLRWATRSENHQDKRQHGTAALGESNPSSKLTPSDVRRIRALLGKMPQKDIAQQFEVSQSLVSRIFRGVIWEWVK